jgi:REP element-mobilizing transposase RayT
VYLITFTCYGIWLPGDARGSLDHLRRDGQSRLIVPNAALEAYRRSLMKQEVFLLESQNARELVRGAIIEVCRFRSWILYGLHVRTNHVHGVVDADALPSRILNDWKAFATRALRRCGEVPSDRIIWTRGGNVRRILTSDHLTSTLHYVLNGQGEPLETYYDDPRLLTPP